MWSTFLKLKLDQAKEEARARDLFSSLVVPGSFTKQAKANEEWELFCPSEAYTEPDKGLMDVWGVEFETMCERVDKEGRGMKMMSARKLLSTIRKVRMGVGTPYTLHNDHTQL